MSMIRYTRQKICRPALSDSGPVILTHDRDERPMPVVPGLLGAEGGGLLGRLRGREPDAVSPAPVFRSARPAAPSDV